MNELGRTRFVTLDVEWPENVPANATSFVFDNRAVGYLVGYLAGLMEAENGARLNAQHIVSAIGLRDVLSTERMVDGFTAGARRALPDVEVLRTNSDEWVKQEKCASIADQHIDQGADILFPAAGGCQFGALSAAGIRGVWGIGVDGDRSYLGAHILATAEKRFDLAVVLAVQSFLAGTLPAGERVVLGLDDDAVGVAGLSPEVPATIRRRVELASAALRRGEEP